MKLLPYLLLEIVMPGGTLLAVALYLYRNRKNIFASLSNRHPAIRPVTGSRYSSVSNSLT
jgi:hypothetical protein